MLDGYQKIMLDGYYSGNGWSLWKAQRYYSSIVVKSIKTKTLFESFES